MGVDFLYTVKRVFKRRWDCGRDELAKGTLFSDQSIATRTLCFSNVGELVFRLGDELLLRVINKELFAYTQSNEMAMVCRNAPMPILSKVIEFGGTAVGRVEKVHEISGAADIVIE